MENHSSKRKIFSTVRSGGISLSPYQSLNLSYGVGDDPASVSKNRNTLKSHHSIQTLLSARQVHEASIFVADNTITKDTELDSFDALMTDIPGIGLMIQQADCQAVTLFDPTQSAIAAIHCGWKGSTLNILQKTVQTMNSAYNTQPSDLYAYISPSLGPCCAEFTNHALELPSSFLAFQIKENYFDFWKISEKQLSDAGINPKNITISGQCTSCSADYFSYRRACRKYDGRTGRCATVIVLL